MVDNDARLGLQPAQHLTYGFFNHKGLLPNILLNLPHVLVSTTMLGMVYWLAPRLERQA